MITVGAYWSIYIVLLAIVEPMGWFGGTYLTKLGIWGNLLLLITPALILLTISIIQNNKNKKYLGVISFSVGRGRVDAFQEIRERANHKIFILGIGMTSIAKYAKQSLAKQAEKVPIDLLMIDPEALEQNPEYAAILEEFLNMKGFTKDVRNSFEVLKEFCEEWNNAKYHPNRIRLRVYKTIPTASMVLIDPEHNKGEAVIEFFIFNSGERRPRFLCKNITPNESMFDVLKDRYDTLWQNSKKIVE